MGSGDGRATIVSNGEIYNYPELRWELWRIGHSFRNQFRRRGPNFLLGAMGWRMSSSPDRYVCFCLVRSRGLNLLAKMFLDL